MLNSGFNRFIYNLALLDPPLIYSCQVPLIGRKAIHGLNSDPFYSCYQSWEEEGAISGTLMSYSGGFTIHNSTSSKLR